MKKFKVTYWTGDFDYIDSFQIVDDNITWIEEEEASEFNGYDPLMYQVDTSYIKKIKNQFTGEYVQLPEICKEATA